MQGAWIVFAMSCQPVPPNVAPGNAPLHRKIINLYNCQTAK